MTQEYLYNQFQLDNPPSCPIAQDVTEKELIHQLNFSIVRVNAPAQQVADVLCQYTDFFYDDVRRFSDFESGNPVALQLIPQIELVRQLVRDFILLDELGRIWGDMEALATESSI
jgi:hypothetical protein